MGQIEASFLIWKADRVRNEKDTKTRSPGLHYSLCPPHMTEQIVTVALTGCRQSEVTHLWIFGVIQPELWLLSVLKMHRDRPALPELGWVRILIWKPHNRCTVMERSRREFVYRGVIYFYGVSLVLCIVIVSPPQIYWHHLNIYKRESLRWGRNVTFMFKNMAGLSDRYVLVANAFDS